MRWFFHNKQPPHQTVEEANDVRVAMVVEKTAHRKVAKKAKEATGLLNELLEANHFHIKIYRAAGGATPKTKRKAA